MKKYLLSATVSVLAMALLACSHTDVKPAAASDEVVDAGMHSDGHVKVSGALDAGTYRENEDYADISTHGGKNGEVIPTERFYSVDREKHAPLGKMLYVLTDDSPAHCIKARYLMVDGKKQLVVYSKSTVPSNYCIYQKTFSSEAEGFSIFVNHGGVCRPSYTNVKVDDQKRKMASVEPVNNTVSMTYCVDNTASFGEQSAHH
jgi:hypothetical protein